jgi:hypothetical protein
VLVGVSFAAGLKSLVIELWLVFDIEPGIGLDSGLYIGADIGADMVPAADDAPGAVDTCPTDGGIVDCCACAAGIVGATSSARAHVFKRMELSWLRSVVREQAILRVLCIGRVST